MILVDLEMKLMDGLSSIKIFIDWLAKIGGIAGLFGVIKIIVDWRTGKSNTELKSRMDNELEEKKTRNERDIYITKVQFDNEYEALAETDKLLDSLVDSISTMLNSRCVYNLKAGLDEERPENEVDLYQAEKSIKDWEKYNRYISSKYLYIENDLWISLMDLRLFTGGVFLIKTEAVKPFELLNMFSNDEEKASILLMKLVK